jgi:hypothetical protein
LTADILMQSSVIGNKIDKSHTVKMVRHQKKKSGQTPMSLFEAASDYDEDGTATSPTGTCFHP